MRKLEFDAIFCDDIRQEVTSKQILIGVYAADMRVAQMPVIVQLALWIRVQNLDIGTHPFDISLMFEKTKISIANFSGDLAMQNDDPANIVVAGIPVNIVEDDRIIAKISIDGTKSKKIGSLIVRNA